jgi:hypothetical protein
VGLRPTGGPTRAAWRFLAFAISIVSVLSPLGWRYMRGSTPPLPAVSSANEAAPAKCSKPPRFDNLDAASCMPPQQEYSAGPDPGPPPPFAEMSDPRAVEAIVQDISATSEGIGWRWTYLEPTLKFYLHQYEGQSFVMDFSIIKSAFKDTGPVTLSCFINNWLLTTMRCPRPGDYHLEKQVPAEWLRDTNPTMVRAILDKVWTAPADGARLGYVLVRAGFRGKPR